ncbi:hypothetical protein DL771_003771 [Monosporascus sp. 5C6A]|nr:hypothetical protein DL771_003771 [Monosporascus sp. 5C6A]
MSSQKGYEQYHLLGPDEETASKSPPHGNEKDFEPIRPGTRLQWRKLAATLIASLCLAASFFLGLKLGGSKKSEAVSPYLKLRYTQSSQLWWNTQYSDEEESGSELDKLWDASIPWESGIIALDNEEARVMDLPESQPFPWDGRRKSIYIVNAHHILHCVRNIYISIQQYRTNKTQTISYPHILHCLDSLRVETMCTADDTLRYVPLNSAHGYRPGDGQPRKCRDWSKVQEFVEAHDPCYRYLNPGDKELSNLERFKFCPRDSQYLPKIRQYFGYGDDWVPEPQEGPRELDW